MLINRQFYNLLFPPKRIILRKPRVNYETNNIIFKNYIIYGFQGVGKTSTVNYLAGKAIQKYGRNNVNAVVSEDGDLELLMHYGLQPKLVNILFSDNITLRRIDRSTLMDYFKIRHLFYKRFERTNGYILSIMALHRFHSIPVELRTTIDGIIFKDSSLNPYDRSIIKKFVGQEYLQLLDNLHRAREKKPSLKRLAIFVSKDLSGIISIPLARNNYLKEINSYLCLIKR
ncbi:MAG: hypothetical protein QXK24_00045 [Ignisphaera sp.]